MDDIFFTFPLLRLPEPVIQNTMRIMTHLEIFGISILSKKSKNLVESLKLSARTMSVTVTDVFVVSFDFGNNSKVQFGLRKVLESQLLQELGVPGNVHIRSENSNVKWTNGMSVKQMLDHLKLIFHTPITRLCFGPNCERFSVESIHKTVGNFQRICFISENHKHNRSILRFFQPKALDLFSSALDNGHVPRYILVQNFDDICVPGVQIHLDDLLITNTQTFRLECFNVSADILIQFLKLWMKGSNPRLEWLLLRFRSVDFHIDDVLKKLNHKVAPLDRSRVFKYSDRKKLRKVVGGWDIWRFDGTQATISFWREDVFVYFCLFVWHDHCDVN